MAQGADDGILVGDGGEGFQLKGPIGIGKAVATVNGKKVAEAELSFAIG